MGSFRAPDRRRNRGRTATRLEFPNYRPLKVQVVRGRRNRDMAHVDGQLGQTHLHVRASAVKANEGLDGKAVSEIVNVVATAPVNRGPSLFEERPDSLANAGAGVGSPRAVVTVSQQWRGRSLIAAGPRRRRT